jgi:hypothetical protein
MSPDDLLRYSLTGIRFQDCLKPMLADAVAEAKPIRAPDLYASDSHDSPIVFGELEPGIADVLDLINLEKAELKGYGKYALPFNIMTYAWKVDLDKHPGYDPTEDPKLQVNALERFRNIIAEADAACFLLHQAVYVNSVFNLATPSTKLSYSHTELCVEVKLAAGKHLN